MTATVYRYFGHLVNALIRCEGHILLVEQQGPQDVAPSWALPGGQVVAGEALAEAVRRELSEETGLDLVGEPRLTFVVQVLRTAAADEIVEGLAFTFACAVSGVIQARDPDGDVLRAAWIEEEDALNRLDALAWYDTAPLRAWLSGNGETARMHTVRRSAPPTNGGSGSAPA